MEPVPKYRNMLVQVLLVVITCGIYALYWFYSTAVEMQQITHDEEGSAGLWTALLLIPLAGFYAMYRHSDLFERVSGEKIPAWGMMLLWVFLTPAVWLFVQIELNRRSDAALRSQVYAT